MNRSLSRQRSRVRVSSSPPFLFKNLPKVLHFRVGTKRHKIGTGNRVCPSRAYVSCVFSRNKSATTSSCALRFSVVTTCVYVSRVVTATVIEQQAHYIPYFAARSWHSVQRLQP